MGGGHLSVRQDRGVFVDAHPFHQEVNDITSAALGGALPVLSLAVNRKLSPLANWAVARSVARNAVAQELENLLQAQRSTATNVILYHTDRFDSRLCDSGIKSCRAPPSLVKPDRSQGDGIIVYVLRGPAARFPRLGLRHSEPTLQE